MEMKEGTYLIKDYYSSYLAKFGDINNISIEDIFNDEDLMDDIHDNNYDLVEAITIPKILEDIKKYLLFLNDDILVLYYILQNQMMIIKSIKYHT